MTRTARYAVALLLLAPPQGALEAALPLRVFAAASLTDALSEAFARYEKANLEIRIVPQFGGSSDLARQILAGAPANLFFSADEAQMERVRRAGLVEPGAERGLLSNRLVVVVPAASDAAVSRLEDLERLSRIALADPEAVPAGVYARRHLEKLGLWDRLRARIVPTLDVRAALAAVASGNVDGGIVYATDARLEPRVKAIYEVPADEGPRIVYPLAVVRSGGPGNDAARDLFRYLSSREAREIFERHGFVFLGE